MKVYVLPYPVNERIDFPSALEKAKGLSSSLAHKGRKAKLYIEDNMYQRAFPQMLSKDGYIAEGIQSQGDKRSRLTVVNPIIKDGNVFFPETGAEELIQQLIGFGIERHDDLADAFALVLGEAIKHNRNKIDWSLLRNDPDNRSITAGLMDKVF